ncbi:MAG: cupin-like domain-containing protein [Pseudomonadota bacterium]
MLAEPDIFCDLAPVRQVHADSLDEMRPFMSDHQPFIVRGLVGHWPLVSAGLSSGRAARDYLQSKARDVPFVVSVGPAENGGRIFYRDDMSMNVRMGKSSLPEIFGRINQFEHEIEQPTVYMSSVSVKAFFDGLHEDNHVDFGEVDALESIWIGTRTRIAAHNDFPDNLACVAVGTRRFTLFPPSEFRNLYIGPIDNTPAGRSVSMVDFDAPDFQRFPKFRDALKAGLTATLNPGDAIFIPSMWWHHVEGLSPFNVLVNYWWRETPRYLGGPQNALNHAIMAIRDLPAHEREHWRDMFDYYVFENAPDVTAHIPEHGRGVLAPLDAESAARLRGFLLKMLNDE